MEKELEHYLPLGSAKFGGYNHGERDVNLAACVELIHSATLFMMMLLMRVLKEEDKNYKFYLGKSIVNISW